jgi:glucokinase
MQVGGGKPVPNAVIGVLGPGTGLGVSGVIPTVDGFVTLGSEGGHVNFAPSDEREFAILQYAWREWQHVSNERLISGPGMEIIYRALAERNGGRQVRPRDVAAIIAGALDRQGCAVPGSAGMLLRHAGRRRGQPGGDAGRLRRHLHRRRHRAAHGRVVRRSPFRARFEAKGRFSATWPTFRPTSSPRRTGLRRRGEHPVRAPARAQRRQHADGPHPASCSTN